MSEQQGPVALAAEAEAMVEAKRALVGMNATVLDPNTGRRTADTALILGALREAADVVERLIALGMNPGGGRHSDLLRRLREADQRIVDRIRQDPEVDMGECPSCHRRVQRVHPRSPHFVGHTTEEGAGGFCAG